MGGVGWGGGEGQRDGWEEQAAYCSASSGRKGMRQTLPTQPGPHL